jgi:hypothetical protein
MPKNKNVLMNLNGTDFLRNDKNYEHLNSLSKSQQEAVKQLMILSMLKDRYF